MGRLPTLIAGAAALAVVFVITGCKVTRAGYESAPYTVIRSDGRFQIRDYPVLVMAETATSGARDGSDGSFNRLFRYITGANGTDQSIPMTTPVFMDGGSNHATMAFVMPAGKSVKELPAPTDDRVQIRETPAGRFAVYRFRGGRNTDREREAQAELEDWMKAESLKSESQPVFAYFDPPWIPGFLRRNEVMLSIGVPADSGAKSPAPSTRSH